MIDLELYKVFYTVVKCGSMTKAAEKLYISQPAVSQAIKQLESDLGGKLFNRVSRGLELTENGGDAVFDAVDKAIKTISLAEDKFKSIRKVATGTLRISASDTNITHFLMRYIKKYHELYPNVTITLKNSNSNETIELVKEHKADIGLINLPVYDKEILLTGQTGEVEDIFVASEKYSHLFDKTIELKNMPNYPILMLDNNTATSKEIYNFLESLNITIVPEFEVSSVEMLVEMAKNGLGIACVPRRYILDELKRQELFEIKTNPKLPLRMTGIVVSKEGTDHSFALREFVRILDQDQYK